MSDVHIEQYYHRYCFCVYSKFVHQPRCPVVAGLHDGRSTPRDKKNKLVLGYLSLLLLLF